MRLTLLIILLSSFCLAQAQVPYSIDTEKNCCHSVRFNNFKATQSNAGDSIDIVYCRMEWSVDPAVRAISGSVTSYFKPLYSIGSISLDLSDTLIVDSVKYHNSVCPYTLATDLLEVDFQGILPAGVLDSVSVFYHGVPRISDDRSFAQDFHDTVNGPFPVIWTLSEPYGAKEWWPCKQNLNDKIDSVDILITTPSPNVVSSIGLLVSQHSEGGFTKFHWKHRYPVAAYLIAFAVTNYAISESYLLLDNNDSVYHVNFFYPEDSAFIAKSYYTLPVMQLFSNTFGKYPFAAEKYGHTQFSWPGGMEHQTNSFMYHLEHHLTAHEMAHQWFGDYITCGSWQDIWLNEGFADFLTGLTYEKLFNGYYWPFWKADLINKITSEPDGSVFCADTTDRTRIFDGRLSYKKGCYLLHMLRWELGDSIFYNAISNYLNDTNLANGYASTQDLISHLELAADTVLSEYFNDWFYGEGYPIYQINWRQDISNLVQLEVYQMQSHASVSFFEMSLPIAFYGDNTDTIVRFKHSFSGQSFEFNPGWKVDSILFDPELWIVTKGTVVTNVEKVDEDEIISVFPNPVSGLLYIRGLNTTKSYSIQIVSQDGKTVYEKNVKGQFSCDINVNGIPSAAYILHIKSDDFSSSQKILIKN